MDLLIDASAVIGCVMNEPEREALLAPVSLPFEIGNAFSAIFKQRRICLEDAVAGIRLFRMMRIDYQQIDLEQAVSLASRLGIYAYDAYVLQCALDHQVEILTLDRGLKAAARMAGIGICEV